MFGYKYRLLVSLGNDVPSHLRARNLKLQLGKGRYNVGYSCCLMTG